MEPADDGISGGSIRFSFAWIDAMSAHVLVALPEQPYDCENAQKDQAEYHTKDWGDPTG